MLSRKTTITLVISILILLTLLYLPLSYYAKTSLKSEIPGVKISWTNKLGFVNLLRRVKLFSEGVRILNNNTLVRTNVNHLTVVLTDKPQTALILQNENGAPSISFSWVVDEKGTLYLFSYLSPSKLLQKDAGTILVKFMGGALQTIQKDQMDQEGNLVLDNKNYSNLFSDKNYIKISK